MRTAPHAVGDGLSDQERGRLHRRFDEILRRAHQGAITFDWVKSELDDVCARMRDGQIETPQVFDELQRIIEGRLSSIIALDQLRTFDPASFIGEGWTIEEDDPIECSIDLTKIELVHMLREGERHVCADARLHRLGQSSYCCLAAAHFQFFWENPHRIPESWKTSSIVTFDGTILLSPDEEPCVLQLAWSDHRARWKWNPVMLIPGSGFGRSCLSAVLAPS